MHEFPRNIPRNESQIISENSIPVRVTQNPESALHADKVTLGIGGLVQMGEIQEPVLREEARLQRHIKNLKATLQKNAYARVRETHPDATLEYSDYPLTARMMERMLEENPELREDLERNNALLKSITEKRYQFGDDTKHDLFVGKEGTLVYSLQTGEQAAYELKKAVVWKRDEHGGQYPDPDWQPRIDDIRTRIRNAPHVADIHQVEVLPEYQGKGLAKALLDVALWDIEHTRRDVEFTVARILSDNPDGEKMIAAFKKAGFEAFSAGRVSWDSPLEFTLVVRENPYFVRKP